MMYLDKEEKALVKELRGLDFLARFAWPVFHSDRLPFYEHAINDDSGNPAFLIINNSLVLVSMTSHSGTGDCSFVNVVNPTLNEMIVAADANASVYTMTTVNTGLQVQTVELSGFIPFTPP